MSEKTIILLFFIVNVFLCNGCALQKLVLLAEYNNFSEKSALSWGGRHYVCRLFRKNNHYYLESRILESEISSGNRFVKYLGENIVFDKEKPFFDSDGRMHIKYRNNSGKECEASVPFGDFYGNEHISDILPYRKNTNSQYSSKYAAAAVLKEEEAVIEAFLPTLQKHIRNNDADAISKMLIYPIHVSCPAIGDTWLENRNEFLKYYPQIFTEQVKKDLLKLQNKDIFCNYQGLMINRGMWFSPGGDGKAYFYTLFIF